MHAQRAWTRPDADAPSLRIAHIVVGPVQGGQYGEVCTSGIGEHWPAVPVLYRRSTQGLAYKPPMNPVSERPARQFCGVPLPMWKLENPERETNDMDTPSMITHADDDALHCAMLAGHPDWPWPLAWNCLPNCLSRGTQVGT
ncbi:hypothetical protein CMUS01_06002 [Colletotrichum musicola]|uniref:Uncharacterized protein n=1 Tax=Colletotrichum musicola TaxID=2175873 RepID=A0A8H6KPS9_9PEZI|nr:hypothetical protein CMUS01_06002 [Colletotrichum musicola]